MTDLQVVVPVRDGAATLARCLDALAPALRAGAAVTVVDDGSWDETAAIAARYPVRLIRHEGSRGASAARNTDARASNAALIAFVDADVVVCPEALAKLVARLRREPGALGANGLLALELTTPGLLSAFANTSIHYQHLRHGPAIASAFTSLCVLRREAFEQMGGWSDGTSRYADDVASRWTLSPCSLRLEAEARGEHLKRVSLRGLMKHRFNVGYFFVESILSHLDSVRSHPGVAVLDLRYPLNTLAAAMVLALAIPAVSWPPVLLVPLALVGIVNTPFALFTLRRRGPLEAVVAIPISAAEGFAYLFGMLFSATVRLQRRARGRA